MESKTKLFGHPVHPILIVLPLGLFISAVVFDIAFWVTGENIFPAISYFNISLGVIGGLLAALFGFLDWLAIPAGTRAQRIGAWHGIGNVVLVLLFGLSWFFRRGAPDFEPSALALTFSYTGILLGLVTAWLGGELVFRLDVGVDRGANLNASNSLSGEDSRAYTDGRRA
jgi:uncharacterized membrane protein